MGMTITELIEALEDIRQASPYGGETEVRVAYQRNYPLAGTVAAVNGLPSDRGDDVVAWIATGEVRWDENPYASDAAWGGDAEWEVT